MPASRPRSLSRERGFECGERASVHDVGGSDPATAGGGDAERHLLAQTFGSMTITIDTHVHAGRDGPPRHGAVHIEMAWRPVDLHDGACLDSRGEQPLFVEIDSPLVPAQGGWSDA